MKNYLIEFLEHAILSVILYRHIQVIYVHTMNTDDQLKNTVLAMGSHNHQTGPIKNDTYF